MNQKSLFSEDPEIAEHNRKIRALEKECCFLRCILISDPDLNPFVKGGNETFLENDLYLKGKKYEELPTDRELLVRELSQTKSQKTNLLKEIENLREDNNDVYSTIESIAKEKGAMTDELNAIQGDIETTKMVINFLVSERDKMKKEIETKDAKLAEYHETISKHGELIIATQNPIRTIEYTGPPKGK